MTAGNARPAVKGTRARADNGMTVEEVWLDPIGKTDVSPILGPDHPGRWLIVRVPRGRIIRWICKEAGNGCPVHLVPAAQELARETGARKWLVTS